MANAGLFGFSSGFNRWRLIKMYAQGHVLDESLRMEERVHPSPRLLERIEVEEPPLKIESLVLRQIEGILVLEGERVVHVNRAGANILKRIAPEDSSEVTLPGEISTISQWMYESKQAFKQENWIMDFRIVAGPLKVFQIQARWLRDGGSQREFLVFKMEDQNKLLHELALGEAKQYGFTEREQQIWILQRENYTYKEIAEELGITSNTVKKHMKNILLKQRSGS